MTQENLATREWMRKMDLYDKDVEEIMTQMNISYPEEDFKNFSQERWDELYRLATVERFKELKDQQSRNRLQKKCDKLEKEWRRISGTKKTVVKSKSQGKKSKPVRSQEESDNLLKQGRALKKYLQKEQIWEKDLFEELVSAGVTCEDDIAKVNTQEKFDEIIRKTKVARFEELKDTQSRNRLNQKLTKFEKIWREKTGIKKTVVKKNQNDNKKKKTPTDKKIQKIQQSRDLKQWMQKQQIWEKELFNDLVRNGINNQDEIVKLDTQEKFDELVRKVRVERFTELKDKQSRNRLDKKLTKFEKLWREKTGIKKTMTKKKN